MRGVHARRIGPYVLHRLLGEGGMGLVYLAEHERRPGHLVALKVVRDHEEARSTLRSRFEAEKEALLRLDHPHIARILDASVTDDEGPWFTMEFIDGPTITRYCQEHALPTSERLALFEDACRGVEHAHQKSVLHRDLKPSNVLVATVDGRPVPKVIDFGIARLLDEEDRSHATRSQGFVLGTPEYMSPEQLDPDADDVDTRTDVYGLGALLYELLADVPPFQRADFAGRGLSEVRRIVREVEPRPPLTRRRRNAETARLPFSPVLGSATDFDTTENWVPLPGTPSRNTAKDPRVTVGRAVGPGSATKPQRRDRPRERGSLTRHILEGLLGRAGDDLDGITLKALQKDRERRYASVGALLDDLDRHRRHLPIAALPTRRWDALRRFARRRRLELTALLIVALLLTSALFLTWSAWRAVREAQRSEEAARVAERVAGDALRVPYLIEHARASWPAEATLGGNLAWIASWLRDADEVLERASFPSAMLAGACEKDREEFANLMEALPTLRELREDVLARSAILESSWPLWERCATSLRDVAGFELPELAPQPHLIPLGIELDRDREHGQVFDPLWIFAVGGTGRLPRRVDLDGHPVAWGEPGFTVFEDDTALLLLLLPGGTFHRGAQGTDPAGPNHDPRLADFNTAHYEIPVEVVRVEPFFLGRYEVTQAQFTRYLRATSRTREELFVLEGPDRHPVTGVDGRDAAGFCRWAGLILPSESQWEYACRAGTQGITWRGDTVAELDRIAWTDRNSEKQVRPVDSWPSVTSPANPWGLYHMLGNVMEWPQDCFFPSHVGAPLDDRPRLTGGNHNRARRGGDAASSPMYARPSARLISHGYQHEFTGFRAALRLE